MARYPYVKIFPVLILLAGLAIGPATAQPRQQGNDGDQTRTRCVPTSDILSYKVESDELVRLKMLNAADILMRLRRHCPQLYFHKYISYTPVNGQLCEGLDDVVSRSGMPCRIASFTDDVVKPDPDAASGKDSGVSTNTGGRLKR